jgi:hypothetical protein
LNGEKFRSRVELDQLMEEITRIDFDTISESDFKLKIAQTFNIDSNFGVNSFEDIKKIFKRITR